MADMADRRMTAHSAPDGDGEACRCQIVGWSRDPAEPHIPSQAEWEQADDCPVHPMTPTEPTRDQGDGAGVVERPTWSALFGTAPDMEFLTEQQEMEHRLAQVTAERDEARAREAGLRARVERVEGLAEEWESWARRASTQRIDAFGDAARHLRAAQDGGV